MMQRLRIDPIQDFSLAFLVGFYVLQNRLRASHRRLQRIIIKLRLVLRCMGGAKRTAKRHRILNQAPHCMVSGFGSPEYPP